MRREDVVANAQRRALLMQDRRARPRVPRNAASPRAAPMRLRRGSGELPARRFA